MRSVSFLTVAVIVGAAALTAACGQRAATAAGASAACGPATPTAPPDRTLTLTVSDNDRSFCVKVGTGVLVYLKGTPTSKWAALRSDSTAMVPRGNGHLMLALGVTGGYFVAVRPGLAAITSSRSPCGPVATSPPPTRPTTSGSRQMTCGVIQAFRVTVRVIR